MANATVMDDSGGGSGRILLYIGNRMGKGRMDFVDGDQRWSFDHLQADKTVTWVWRWNDVECDSTLSGNGKKYRGVDHRILFGVQLFGCGTACKKSERRYESSLLAFFDGSTRHPAFFGKGKVRWTKK